MKNILIIDAYHDSDRGGAGILAGIINILKKIEKEKDDNFNIGVLYRVSENDNRYNTAFRHTKKKYPFIKFYGSIINTEKSQKGFLNKFRTLEKIIKAFFMLCFPFYFRSNPTMKALLEADYIFSKGGHFYQFDNFSLISCFVSNFLKYYTILLAIRLKKTIFLLSHSFGPFSGKWNKLFSRIILKKVTYLSTRKILLDDVGLLNKTIDVLPDLAFALKPASKEEIKKYLSEKKLEFKNYAVFTPRYWNFGKKNIKDYRNLYNNYLHVQAKIIDDLISKKLIKKVALVRHNDGKHSVYEDDILPLREIYNKIKNKKDVIIFDEDYSPSIQSALYGASKILIGTRLHSVIFSLIGGAPALAIGYTHKSLGIMRMLNLEEYVVDINNFTYSESIKKIEDILRNEKEILEKINHKLKKMKRLLENKVTMILS